MNLNVIHTRANIYVHTIYNVNRNSSPQPFQVAFCCRRLRPPHCNLILIVLLKRTCGQQCQQVTNLIHVNFISSPSCLLSDGSDEVRQKSELMEKSLCNVFTLCFTKQRALWMLCMVGAHPHLTEAPFSWGKAIPCGLMGLNSPPPCLWPYDTYLGRVPHFPGQRDWIRDGHITQVVLIWPLHGTFAVTISSFLFFLRKNSCEGKCQQLS